ncbi:MAG: hypothetical protein CMM83_03220 [Rhodospirillales bacterium]|nr:hypothetical protein [Rhodospirillales bacterium]
MKIFLVHTRLGHDPKVVRDGFSLTAFIFTGFWALWNRMWFLTIIIFLGWAVLWGFYRFLGLSNDCLFIAFIALSTFIGFGANEWVSLNFLRKGYTLSGIVAARHRDAALRRWYDFGGSALIQ